MSDKWEQLSIMFLCRVDARHVPGAFRTLFFLFSFFKILNFTNTGQTDIVISQGLPANEP